MNFLQRWFGKKQAEPEYTNHNTGYRIEHGQSYHNLMVYMLYLNQNAGKSNAQPTGPEHFYWWEKALFDAVESSTVHLLKGNAALEYIFRINFTDHDVVIPVELKKKAIARLKLGIG